jgi:radical SAM protein with 4Fe4S-binding SPASM domain
MHERMYHRARHAIEQYLIKYGNQDGFIRISVNAYTHNRPDRIRRISEYFSKFGNVSVQAQDTNSRAGTLNNRLVRIATKSSAGRFAGCERIVAHLHIAWDGRVYLCCNDYDQKTILGDINRSEIREIMQSGEAVNIRAEIYGLARMSPARLCLKCTMLKETQFEDGTGQAYL